jgi:hypothetical protein
MDNKNLKHTVLVLGEDFSADEFFAKFGNGATFPQVTHRDKLLGGLVATTKYLLSEKLI